jgi:endonuclease/exonuclease/phosphatase (EEP) superfamily protein YafD
MAESLTPWFAVPTMAALGVAAATRRRSLAVVAGALAALHLVWAAPELRPRRPGLVEADHAPRLRLFSANLLFTNVDMDGIAGELAAEDPDVVVLQEVSPPNLAALEANRALDPFPHRWVTARPDALGTAFFSRLPLEDVDPWRAGGLPMPRASVVVGDRRLRLYNVHTRAPFGPRGRAIWEAQLAALGQEAAAEPGPVAMAGDFNANSGHRPFRALLRRGLRDAHLDRGRWWATTWPSNRRPVPPLTLLDHVLVSRHVAVLDVREGTGRGSDHLPVVVDLVLT